MLFRSVEAVRAGIPLEEILPAFTASTADVWRLAHKGRIGPGCDADLVFVDPASMCIEKVIARGRVYTQARGMRRGPDPEYPLQ